MDNVTWSSERSLTQWEVNLTHDAEIHTSNTQNTALMDNNVDLEQSPRIHWIALFWWDQMGVWVNYSATERIECAAIAYGTRELFAGARCALMAHEKCCHMQFLQYAHADVRLLHGSQTSLFYRSWVPTPYNKGDLWISVARCDHVIRIDICLVLPHATPTNCIHRQSRAPHSILLLLLVKRAKWVAFMSKVFNL